MRRVLLAAVAAVLLMGCSSTSTNENGYVTSDGAITTVEHGKRKPAPLLEGDDLQGRPVSSAAFAGKTLVVNVWGSWCPPCRAEAPALAAVSKELADQDVQFLGITNRDQVSSALAFERRNGITYPSIFDNSGKQTLGFADTGLPVISPPATYVIDSEGNLAARVLGAVSESTLRGLIEDTQKSVS